MMEYYVIAGLRCWSVAEARFVDAIPEGAMWQELYNGNELMPEDMFVAWLQSLGLPLGELAPIEEVRAAAMETLRLRKWQAKDAGITVNGIAIDTDDRGQATISGAVTNVILDPTFTATWKTNAVDEHGQSIWIVLDATMIVGLSKALTAYTEACFGVEAMKQSEVAALSTVAEIRAWLETSLDTGWPDQTMTLGV